MPQKEIELILLRQWASYLETPIWLMGPDFELLYYNEPAEPILGRRFEEAGPMPGHELDRIFTTTTLDGDPINAGDLPINIALTDRRPAHLSFRILPLDGSPSKPLTVTAIPLEGHGGRNLGAMAMFWKMEQE